MPRLSIVIPCLGEFTLLERTLVSLLSNRPEETEIVVALNAPYADPYQLSEEVRFIQAPRGAGRVECLNAGLAASAAPLVHFLGCGVEVVEGWADAALAHFDSASVGAVASVMHSSPSNNALTAPGATRPHALHRAAIESVAPPLAALVDDWFLGPRLRASFFRREVFTALGGEICRTVHDSLAEIDLALALDVVGWETHVEPRAIVADDFTEPALELGAWQCGLHIERLRLRNASAGGSLRTAWSELRAIADDLRRIRPLSRAVRFAGGRLAGLRELFRHRRHYRRLVSQQDRPRSGRTRAMQTNFRLDRAHVERATTANPDHAAAGGDRERDD